MSTTGSEFSELAESYLSSDWSVADDLDLEESDVDWDLTRYDVITDINSESFAPVSSLFSAQPALVSPGRNQTIPKEPLAVLPTSCGRSTSTWESFDWMEDYMTPEVVDLLADDWLVAADNICLRDVTVI